MWIILLVNIIILASSNEVLAGNCDTFLDNLTVGFDECCSLPNITDDNVEKKIDDLVKKMSPDGKVSNKIAMACKVAQLLFTEMNLIKNNLADRESFVSMINSKVKDPVWIEPLKSAFDQCQKPITDNAAKIQDIFSKAPIGIKKEECDPQYLVMFLCLHLDTFANCPKTSWKANEAKSKNCTTMKTAIQSCGKDIDVLNNLVAKTGGNV